MGLHDFTTKEVLNKVLLDSSGNAVDAFSHTTQEALNAALDSANSRLNVSLEGGTISGDVTITGDLTVSGGGNTFAYNEVVTGDMIINRDASGDSAENGVGLYVDFDRTVAASGTAAHNDIGINLDVNSASLGTSSVIGMDIDVVGATSGTHTATGLTVNVSGSDTNYAALFNGGNVGIGTTSPLAALHVEGQDINHSNASGNALFNFFPASSSNAYIDVETAGSDLHLRTSSTSRIVIQSGGNVGIGVTAPSAKIDIADSGMLALLGSSSGTTRADATSKVARVGVVHYTNAQEPVGFLYGQSTASKNQIGIGGGSSTFNAATEINFWTAANQTTTTGTNRMHIDSSGNVGIGTTPTYDLDVSKAVSGGQVTLRVANSSTDANSSAKLYLGAFGASGTGDPYIYFNDDVNDWALGIDKSDSSKFKISDSSSVGANDRLVIDTSGNVGIGTAAPIDLMDLRTDPTNTSQPGAATTGADPHNAIRISSTGNAVNEKIGIAFGGYSGYLHGGIYGVGDSVSNNTSGDITFDLRVSDTDTTFTEVMRITHEGNVGIGTASPSDYHARADDLVIATSGSTGITIVSGTTSEGNIFFADGTSGSAEYAGFVQCLHGSSNLLKLGVNGENKLILDINSRISLSNNDTSGTGGQDSTSGNTIFGYLAGDGLDGTSNAGYNNVFMGHKSGNSITTGDGNVIIGNLAGNNTTDVDNAVIVGNYAGQGVMSNLANGTVAVGYFALQSLTTGAGNVAVGYQALMTNTDGTNNTAIGYDALKLAPAGTIYNTAVGHTALAAINHGDADRNTAVGHAAGDALTTGTQNTCIGNETDPSANDAINQTVLGNGATGVANHSVTLGNASVTDVYMAQDKGASVHADYVHSQNVPNHVANTMSAPYYRMDGDGNQIDLGTSTNLDVGTGDYSLEAMVRIEDLTGELNFFSNYDASTTDGVFFNIQSSKLISTLYESGTSRNAVGNTTIVIDKWYHFVTTVDRDSATGIKIYINGVEETYSAQSDVTAISGAVASSANKYLSRAWNSTADGIFGEYGKFTFWNKALTATEVKELYSGASVPFKYKGANQTDLASGYDFTSGWATSSATVVDANTFRTNASATGSVRNDYGTKGKRTRIRVAGTTPTGCTITVIGVDTLTNHSGSLTGTFDSTFEFLNIDSGYRIQCVNTVASTKDTDITTFTITEIGAVAEYDGSGVTNTKWYDKSGNELHGTVTGATDENTAGAPVISENHPAFLAHPASTQAAFAEDSAVTVVMGTEVFDQGSNFATNTFTAPVTGKYQLNAQVQLKDIEVAYDYYQISLVTSNKTYYSTIDPDGFDSSAVYFPLSISILADMDVSDTAIVKITAGGTGGGAGHDVLAESFFSGYLVC